MADTSVMVMLGLGLLGIVSVIVWMSFLTQNKDRGAEIKIELGIVGGLTAVIVGIFAIASYMYFNANINLQPNFVLWMTFFNLFLGLFAVSVATIQVT